MVNNEQGNLDQVFSALADGTRRAILKRLADGDAVVSELAAPFEMSLPAISKHLGVLERAGLIARIKQGRIRRCELHAAPMADAVQWLAFYQQFWGTRLDSLADFLAQQENLSDSDSISN